MYNRYIPNAQGGFERVLVRQSSEPAPIVPEAASDAQDLLRPLKNLIPSGMDTGDILIILIFLLVLLDAEREDVPSALLMLAAFILA